MAIVPLNPDLSKQSYTFSVTCLHIYPGWYQRNISKIIRTFAPGGLMPDFFNTRIQCFCPPPEELSLKLDFSHLDATFLQVAPTPVFQRLVEQDLIICRALVSIYNESATKSLQN